MRDKADFATKGRNDILGAASPDYLRKVDVPILPRENRNILLRNVDDFE
jgi:hypothetical protein